MKNPQVFYKVGQTHLTQTKHDLGDTVDLTWFEPWPFACFHVFYMVINQSFIKPQLLYHTLLFCPGQGPVYQYN